MSLTLLGIAFLDLIVIVLLSSRLRGKGEGVLPSYVECLNSLFHDGGLQSIACWIHYLAIHLFPLFLGLGFLLHTDINFLPVLFTILITMQLLQRVYPGSQQEEGEENEHSGEV